jgi:hypothetical protein
MYIESASYDLIKWLHAAVCLLIMILATYIHTYTHAYICMYVCMYGSSSWSIIIITIIIIIMRAQRGPTLKHECGCLHLSSFPCRETDLRKSNKILGSIFFFFNFFSLVKWKFVIFSPEYWDGNHKEVFYFIFSKQKKFTKISSKMFWHHHDVQVLLPWHQEKISIHTCYRCFWGRLLDDLASTLMAMALHFITLTPSLKPFSAKPPRPKTY